MARWFTSDQHFGHARILRYCDRPFPDVSAMHQTLIERWNRRVQPGDVVYCLGDFALGVETVTQPILDQLHGRIVLIRGNHDWGRSVRCFLEVHRQLTIELAGNPYTLIHDPYRAQDPQGTILCGHVHQAWRRAEVRGSRVINVGVDVRDFTPMSEEEIVAETLKDPFPDP